MKVAFLAPCPAVHFKNILRLNDDSPEQPATWIINLAKALSIQGIVLHVITQSDKIEKAQTIELDGATYHFVKRPRRFNLHTLFQFDKRRLHRKLKKISPDIVHAHGTEDAYSYAGITCGLPCIISLQGVISIILSVDSSRRNRIVRYFEKHTIKKGRYFIAKTPFARQFIAKVNPKAVIFDIENPVKIEYFSLDPTLDGRTILFVGTLNKRKGVEDLLRAFTIARESLLNKEIRLRIIGYGSAKYQEKLKTLCSVLNISSQVDFLGFLPPDKVVEEMENSSLLVLPSYIDNSPNVVSEAMASAVPVIATRVGGIPWMIKDGVTGLLNEVGDINALSCKIAKIMNDRNLRQNLGKAGKIEAMKRFYPDLIACKVIEAYNYVLNNH